jgi:cytochrome P450
VPLLDNRTDDHRISELPLRKGGDRLQPRLPFDDLRRRGPLLRFRYPNGVVGWLTTDAELFRAVLSDPRFHAKRFAGEPQTGVVSVAVPEMPGFIPGMNGPEHLRVRRLAAGDFSVKRIRDMQPLISDVVARYLDAIEAAGPPVDLYAALCLPVPSEVIAHILGVPGAHAKEFQDAARLTVGGQAGTSDPGAAARAVASLHKIISAVAGEKRLRPADDLLTRLVSADPPLSDAEICGLCTNLLIAGHESTSSTAALSVVELLRQPRQLDVLKNNPERLPQFVEELARMRTILVDAGAGIPRLATEDVEVAGHLIRAGEWVMLSNGMANVDPSVCPHDPLTLDFGRMERPSSLTFGFGPHTCLGQHLARAELQAILGGLFRRIPGLRLAAAYEELPWLENGFGYRVAELPVTW